MLEQELVQLFGVSRTPVREALIRLQNEQLVQIIPRHGVRVRNVSMADIEEVFQVQTSLEATAASTVAARKPGARELKPSRKSMHGNGARLREERPRRMGGARAKRSTRGSSNMSDNPRLTQIVGECSEQVRRVRELTLRLITPDESQARICARSSKRCGRAMCQRRKRYAARIARAIFRRKSKRLQRFRILDV